LNPNSRSAALFVAFYLIFLALRQQGGVICAKNQSKISN
jgi:hypothetical protein